MILQSNLSEQEEEVDEPLPLDASHSNNNEPQVTNTKQLTPTNSTMIVPTAALMDEEEEEEEDEPLVLPNVSNNLAIGSATLLPIIPDTEEFDEPLEQRQMHDILSSVTDNVGASAAMEEMETLPAIKPEDSTTAMLSTTLLNASANYQQAYQAVKTDPYDMQSWQLMIDETLHQRGDSSKNVPSLYEDILVFFPRSIRIYRNYADYFLSICSPPVPDRAREVLYNGALQCYSVDLWTRYLQLLRQVYQEQTRIVNQSNPSQRMQQLEMLQKLRSELEPQFEQGLELLGWAIDAYPLWRVCLDFINEWYEFESVDAARKVSSLRKTYHRALSVPLEAAEQMWKDYEGFERSRSGNANDGNMDALMQELMRKHQHSRSVLRERRKLVSVIQFERLALLPSNNAQDLQQLENWSNWISYELGCPDYLNPDSFRPMCRLVFQQCLNCFYHYAEVWISFARFEQQQNNDSIARSLLQQGIVANPQVMFLRIALAELEECNGNEEAVREILYEMFHALPCGFTFALYQRFVRRVLGIQAARKLFSETLVMRKQSAKIAIELFMAHAALEIDVNCSPQTGIKALNLARQQHPGIALQSLPFLQLYVKALLRVGDIHQLRAILTSALDGLVVDGGASGDNGSVLDLSGSTKASLKKRMSIYDLFLEAEVTLGSSDLVQLNKLRDARNKLRLQLEEHERMQRLAAAGISTNTTSGNPSVTRNEELRFQHRRGLFDTSFEIIERYDCGALLGNGGKAQAVLLLTTANLSANDNNQDVSLAALPELDQELRDRCRGRSAFDRLMFGQGSTSSVSSSLPMQWMQTMKTRRNEGSGGNGTSSTMSSMDALQWLPSKVKELLLKVVPVPVAVALDVDEFLRHMKSLTLPPRPEANQSEADNGHKGTMSEMQWREGNEDMESAVGTSNSLDLYRRRKRSRK